MRVLRGGAILEMLFGASEGRKLHLGCEPADWSISDFQTFRFSDFQIFGFSDFQIFRISDFQVQLDPTPNYTHAKKFGTHIFRGLSVDRGGRVWTNYSGKKKPKAHPRNP